MKLYHGCSVEHLQSIVTQGLCPWSEKKSNWKKAPSRPDMVYPLSLVRFRLARLGLSQTLAEDVPANVAGL